MKEIVDKPQTSKKTTSAPARAQKAQRVPLGRYREILGVYGKDPAFYYRWVKDVTHNGSRILEMQRAGYELVSADEVTVGEDKIDRDVHDGGVVRLNYGGETLYLMKQPMEFREEDVALHHKDIDDTERSILNPNLDPEDSGNYGPAQYGEIKVTR